MNRYLSTRSPYTVVALFLLLVLFRNALGIGFENIYVNDVFGLFLFSLPIYLFFLILKTKFENKFAKIAVVTFSGFFALFSLVLVFIGAIVIYSTAYNGGVDQEEIHTLRIGASEVIVYRSDAGAPTSFDLSVASRKTILPGIYIEHQLCDIYGASDVTLTQISPSSIRVDAINFTDSQYRAEYMNGNPKVTEGTVLKIDQ